MRPPWLERLGISYASRRHAERWAPSSGHVAAWEQSGPRPRFLPPRPSSRLHREHFLWSRALAFNVSSLFIFTTGGRKTLPSSCERRGTGVLRGSITCSGLTVGTWGARTESQVLSDSRPLLVTTRLSPEPRFLHSDHTVLPHEPTRH